MSKTLNLVKKYANKRKNHRVKFYDGPGGLKCQGKGELKFLKEVEKEKKPLPKKADPQVTPMGTYTPDFEYPTYFVEVKSIGTLLCSLGLATFKGPGKPSDLQWQKIKWVAKNVKPILIIVYLSNKEAIPIVDIKQPNITIVLKGGKLLKA